MIESISLKGTLKGNLNGTLKGNLNGTLKGTLTTHEPPSGELQATVSPEAAHTREARTAWLASCCVGVFKGLGFRV